MKLTRAYIEGYVEGRFGNENNPRNPHSRTSSINEWNTGHQRGVVVKHFTDETNPKTQEQQNEVRAISKARGDRI